MRKPGKRIYVTKEVKINLRDRKLNATNLMPFKWKALFILCFPEYKTLEGSTLIDNVVYKHTADVEVVSKIEWLAGQIDSMKEKSYKGYTTKRSKPIAA